MAIAFFCTNRCRTPERIDALLEILRASAWKDLGDFFEFQIGPSVMELDAPPYSGSRFVVEVRVDEWGFERFDLKVGIGDVWIEPLESLKSNDYLAFAGFGSETFPSISREQQFAENLHAYTLPRPEGRPNSRVKDFIDMNLLIQHELKVDFLAVAFKRRGTHALDLNVQPPPTAWGATFREMAEECELEPDIEVRFKTLADFLKRI